MAQAVKVAAPPAGGNAAPEVKGRPEDDKAESGAADPVAKGVAAPEKIRVTSENCKIECRPSAVELQPNPTRILNDLMQKIRPTSVDITNRAQS